MLSVDGRHVIVFNGEIYNFLELRRELEAPGTIFKTQSDTEVIVAAWQAWREGMLSRFNGMWALAIFDTQTRDLFLARDRFGIKPLLYAISSKRFVFASEQRALVKSGLVATSVDIDVARRLLLDAFGVEGSERTLCNEVRRLQGGHFMWLRQGKPEIRRWWRTVDHLPALPKTDAERIERFGELFRDAVALRMRSDVPIGTCLSGGFDSSAVICAMSAHEKAGMGPRDNTAWRHAFVATFPGASNDERPSAEQAAAWAEVDPTFLEVGPNDALIDLDRILDDNDDVYISLPSAAWLIYQELRRQGVVVSLDGHGADELMGAYRQQGEGAAFRARNALAGIASGSERARRGVDLLRALTIRQQGYYFLRGGLREIPSQLSLVGDDDPLPGDWSALNRRLYRMFHGTVLPTILRNFDRLSMAHGVEVRMPFMDWRLVTYTMALPDASKSSNSYTKMVARQAMAGRMPEFDPHGAPQSRLQFTDAGMVERSACELDQRAAWSQRPGILRTGRRRPPAQDGRPPERSKNMGLGVRVADLALYQYEMGNGTGRVRHASLSKQRAGFLIPLSSQPARTEGIRFRTTPTHFPR